MEGLIMAFQMILALSIIVAIHEFGHLITAKIFGMKVEKYFIGFPPKIFSFMYKGTEYGLGSIPLGGFVKIAGIIDESFDTKHMNKKPKEWEFRVLAVFRYPGCLKLAKTHVFNETPTNISENLPKFDPTLRK